MNGLSFLLEDLISINFLDLLAHTDEFGVEFIEITFRCQLSQMSSFLGIEIN